MKNSLSLLARLKYGRSSLTASRQRLFNKLKKNDIAIDCGANVGSITKMMAKNRATVYAFEPNPYAYKILKEKFGNDPNIYCINKGVLDREDSFPLYFHENSDLDEVHWSTGSSLLKNKKNIKCDKFTLVETVDLSEFIKNLSSRVALCKLDVEGVEVEIINKLIDTGVIKKIDLLLVETHDHKIPELREKTDQLRDRIKKEQIKNIDLTWI